MNCLLDYDYGVTRTFYHLVLDRILDMSVIDPGSLHGSHAAATVTLEGYPLNDETMLFLASPNSGHVRYVDLGFASYIEGELERLHGLTEGWDGYRGRVIDPDVLDAARRLAARFPQDLVPRPHVVPLAAGTLQYEWSAGNVALELEFESPTTIRYLKWNPAAGEPEEDTVQVADYAAIESLLHWYARQHV